MQSPKRPTNASRSFFRVFRVFRGYLAHVPHQLPRTQAHRLRPIIRRRIGFDHEKYEINEKERRWLADDALPFQFGVKTEVDQQPKTQLSCLQVVVYLRAVLIA